MLDLDSMAENHYAARDPQFADEAVWKSWRFRRSGNH